MILKQSAIAPAFLALCLLLGGSAQGIWGNALLQVLAVLILAWVFLDSGGVTIPISARRLLILFGVATAYLLVQLLPLPPSIWANLPGHQIVTEGRSILGLPPDWSPISLAPYDGAAALLFLFPPLAVLLAILKLNGTSAIWLAAALVGTAFLGILLGLLQVTSVDPTHSPWYLFKFSSFGFATGFFANSNHMATLLLLAIPFTVALGAALRRKAREPRVRLAVLTLIAGALGVVLLGLILNRSLAGLGLGIPVTVASLMMVIPTGRNIRIGGILISLLVVAAFIAVLFSPLSDKLAAQGAAASVSTRTEMLSNSLEAAKHFPLVGSGFGTFARVYPLFNDPERVGGAFINHAHNDYLEIALETGLAGGMLVLLFLLWWAATVKEMLATPSADEFAKAGAIGSAAILLHSLVDFPLRTSGIAASFAMCLGLMIASRRSARSKSDLRPPRHVVID
jgi:O-antigen ligase